MTTNDELARLRAAFAAPAVLAKGAKEAKGAPEREACPPSDRIWLAVRGELPPDELREIVDHIATCPACAEDWRIAMVFEEESRAAPAPPIPVRSRSATSRHRVWIALAASILVAVVGFQIIPKPEVPEQEERYRGEEIGIHSLIEGQSLPREAFILRWTPMDGAEAYNLEVQTAYLDPLFRAEGLTTTFCQVPPDKLARLQSGDKVHWKVTPVVRGGDLPQFQTFTTLLQ